MSCYGDDDDDEDDDDEAAEERFSLSLSSFCSDGAVLFSD